MFFYCLGISHTDDKQALHLICAITGSAYIPLVTLEILEGKDYLLFLLL